ncbi:hypothetical protein BCR33DRAFT_715026 [Rhizoclosmatium globosum]|uniref:Uncharacterized protein n=1 Tax=Rhizoclosmatium globosum TaxID=329046 RepID=A0A1Y2CJS7_9FUNG|nr:hypothetical protein BCR33DRAFT_715026 [Rhizoclosmatium globosum]|eukprot:ORY47279.1 hypothetical protein BCR33DRAFT_715026 [Rhizoclosmatium globosum]
MEIPSFRYKTLPIRTDRESKYMTVLNEILIKPDWWIKLKDEAIVTKWKDEVRGGITALLADEGNASEGEAEENVRAEAGVAAGGEVGALTADESAVDEGDDSQWEDVNERKLVEHVTDKEFVNQVVDFLFQELHYLAANCLISHKNGGLITPTSSHGVFISDSVVPIETVSRLTKSADAVEADSLEKNKWHEGSDGKVLDLIHPSDYCLVYGRSLQRDNISQPFGYKPFKYAGPKYGDVSEKFQWLPSEFKVKDDGSVEIRSYINNLNCRQHPELQESIRSVFEIMVPMFELALGSLETKPDRRIEASMDNNDYQQDQWEWQIDEFLRHKYGKDVNLRNGRLRDEARSSDEFDEFQDDLWERMADRPVNVPGLPKTFQAPTDSEVHRFNLAGRNLQVIVKMASIHLTPEKPSFTGGSWHLEGMENEAIAATGILYYAMDNITSSRLTFRSVYEADEGGAFSYEQSDFAGLEKVFNIENEISNNAQVCGQIEARENRCVVFPNYLHHKVEDFELQDKTHPGHRKILAFFVVHPDFEVTSTADVGMQQVDWAAEELSGICGFGSKLPIEIVRQIALATGAVLTEREAIEVAHQVMEERKNTPEDAYANIQQIYLCEH